MAGDFPRVRIRRLTAVLVLATALLPVALHGASRQQAGAVSGSAVLVAAEATDDVGVAGVQFLLNGIPIGTEDNSYPYSVMWDTTSVPNGLYSLRARARDGAGNESLSEPVDVLVDNAPLPDTTPPEVAVVAPLDGETVTGATTLVAEASDDTGVEGVAFYRDEVLVGEAGSAPWQVQWDTSLLGEGSYVLVARAWDAEGNLATSRPVTVRIENPDADLPPEEDPAPDEGRAEATVFDGWVEMILERDPSGAGIRIRARTELAGVEALSLEIDRTLVASAPSPRLDYLWNTAGLLGFHEVRLSGLDAEGVPRAATAVYQVEIDPGSSGPGRRLGQQIDPAPYSTAVLVVTPLEGTDLWHIEAASSLDDIWSMELLVDGVVVADSRRGKPISLDWAFPAVAGPHELMLVAYDRTGVRAFASLRWE